MKFLVAIFTLVALMAPFVYGQTVGANVQGSVTDASGGVLPGVQITAKNLGTAAIHETASDERGRYYIPLLSPGEYEVQAALPGFTTVTHRGVHLTVGQTAVIDVRLEVGAINQEVSVVAEASPINLTSAAITGLVTDRQIRDLPLNGRSFQQLALLQPGVTAALAAGNDVVGGRTPKITINGARPEQNNFLLDGTDINNVYNKTPGSVGGVLLGVDAVLEFQVLTNSYSAEFGRSAGGVINAVTRSGENTVHGSAFEFLRNSALDAKNFFDAANKPIPPFKRNQFGGAFGGPIRRDKTFFFGAYEGLIERLGITGLTSVPDLDARQGILPGRPRVTLHPAIPAYMNLFLPEPNGRNLGGGIAEYLFSQTQPTDEHFVQGRVDHNFSNSDRLFVRYTIDNGKVKRTPPNKPPVTYTQERSRNQYVTIDYQHTFSPSLINEFRFGFNRSTSLADNIRTVNIPPSMSWIPGEPFGYFTIQGVVTEAVGDYRLPRNDRLNNFSLLNDVLVTRGRHQMKFGFQGQRIQFNQNTTSQRGGIVVFSNLENFLTGTAQNVDFAVKGLIDPDRGYRQSLFAFYGQDDVRLKQNLTLNLGMRYEFITVPTEVNGKISNLRNPTDSTITIGGSWHNNPSLKNFAPRLGLAWDPFRTGRTSVRAGFGLFFDQILPKYYFFSGSLNPPFTTRTTILNPPFPNVVANFDPNAYIVAQLQSVNFNLQTPYIIQYNLSVQRELPGNVDVTLGYAGSRGVHLFRLGDANLAPETIVNGRKVYQPQLGRRNPKFAGIWHRVTDAQSFYNAFQLSAVRRFANGFRAQTSYTFSRSIDDASGINSQDFSNVVQYGLDWYDRTIDRGLSAFHAKHNLSFNWTYNLPFGSGLSGVPHALLAGWQLNNITTITSGHPFTVRLGFNRSGNLNTTSFSMHERPNLKPGASNNPVLGSPDRYWDINAFELPPVNERGNVGRNTLIGPRLVNLDFSLGKSFIVSGERTLQFRLEVFNAPNHPNFAVPSGVIAFTNGAGAVSPTWGRITSTVTTARQIQFGLKFTY